VVSLSTSRNLTCGERRVVAGVSIRGGGQGQEGGRMDARG
jgi:hypothetical protein